MSRKLPAASFLGAALLWAPGCTQDTRDAHCSPDAPDRATDPGCIYAGAGQAPPFIEPPCAEDGGGAAPRSCPSFYEVLEVLTDPVRGNCSNAGCHGDEANAARAIFLPADDAHAFYAGLTQARGSVGRPYVVPDDPRTVENEALASWIGCNLRGEPGGGFPMPIPAGMHYQTDVDVVSDWVRCGAPPPDDCDTGGAGGGCAL